MLGVYHDNIILLSTPPPFQCLVKIAVVVCGFEFSNSAIVNLHEPTKHGFVTKTSSMSVVNAA